MAPPKKDDPRLGYFAFWLWVLGVAGVTYALWPLFEIADRPLNRFFFVVWAAAWLAWKFGLVSDWDDTPREKEEAWATGVGVFIAGFGREFWS